MRTYLDFFNAQTAMGALLHEDTSKEKAEWVKQSAHLLLVELETVWHLGKIEYPAYKTLMFRQEELNAKIDYIMKLNNLRKGYDYENTKLGADLFPGSVIIT